MGIANDNVTVRIVGDASGVQPAVEQTAGSLGGLEPLLAELNASMKALTAQMAEGFTTGAASAKKLAVSIEEAKVAATGAGAGFTGMIGRIHEGAESVRTFQMRAKEFAEAYVAMFAIDRIAEFIAHMGEAAEKVEHLSQQFGMSIAEVQRLQGVATATGIPIDALTRGMAFLDKNMATAAAGSKRMQSTMQQVGVSFNDGRTQMEKLATVADKFKNMDDGPKKVALAMQLFGKSGRELIPILNLGSAGIERLNEKMNEYGVVNEGAIAKGAALAQSVNETKLGFMGVENVLTDALAPAFKMLVDGLNETIAAFIKSYKEGGIVKDVFTVISAAIKITITFVKALGEIFSAVWGAISAIGSEIASLMQDVFGKSVPSSISATDQAMNFFRSIIVLTKDLIIDFVDVVSGLFRELAQTVVTFGKVAYDALTLNWGSIEGDWANGLGKIRGMVEDTANKIRGRAAEMSAAFHGTLKFDDGKKTGLELPKAGGDFSFDPSKGGKEKKPKDDLVQKLEQQLEEKKAAWEKEQLAQGTAQQYSLESEAAFWAQALQRHNLSAKDRFEITKKWISAEQALQKEHIEEQLDGYKRELADADKNAAAKLDILRREQAVIHKIYGDRSREARTADDAVYQAEKQAADQRIQLEQSVIKAQQQIDQGRVDRVEANAQLEEQLGLISKGRLLQQERQFEQQRYQIDLQELNKRKALIDPARDPVAYQQINLQVEQLERTHQQKLTQIDRQAVLQRTAIERQGIQNLASSWATTLSKMATLQEGFGQGVRDLWMGLVQTIAGALEQVIEHWLTQWLSSLLIGKAAHMATSKAEILGEAAKAGAGGVASMAAAPFPMDMTAPAFGASMFSAAAAYAAVPSGAGGIWDVEGGLTMLHEKEMVLPAWAASPLRAMLTDRDSAGESTNPTKGGDIHFHNSPTFNGNQGSLWQQMVDQHGREMRRWIKREAGNGAFQHKQAA